MEDILKNESPVRELLLIAADHPEVADQVVLVESLSLVHLGVVAVLPQELVEPDALLLGHQSLAWVQEGLRLLHPQGAVSDRTVL